jgi:hypothetical protein
MPNPSSDNATESKRPQPDRVNHDTSNPDEQSDYYYDDATGYEVYEDKDDEEEVQNRER